MDRSIFNSKALRARLASVLTLLIVVSAGANFAKTAVISDVDPIIAASFTDKQSILPTDEITFTLSRPLGPNEGRVAVIIGSVDVSSLLTQRDNLLIYSPRVIPLPPGESPVTIYIVDSSSKWREISKLTLRVEAAKSTAGDAGDGTIVPAQITASPEGAAPAAPVASSSVPSAASPTAQITRKHGFDKSIVTPTFTIGTKSQLTETHFPDANRPPRSTFADLTLQGGFRSDLARGSFSSQTQFDLVGTSFRKEALRFGQLQQDAPLVDLANYSMQFQAGKTKVTVGQLSFGSNQFLINNFSSRGVSVVMPLSSRLDVGLAAMNGTNVVGWSNFFGVDKRDHQFVTGTAGFEFKPEHRGELRFELSILDGRLQPLSGFNQGNINDVERSQGAGVRLLGADPTQRWRFDSGFTRSRFSNPADPLLNQGFNVVQVRTAIANAQYFDGVFNILQNAKLSDSKRATIGVTYKYSSVDPLFKSVAAPVQADRLQNEFGLTANIGDVTATVTHFRFHDNLGNVRSVLESLSRRTAIIIGTPLSALFNEPGKPSPWLPRVSYSLDEVHQFGAAIPVNGGFETNLSTIPDQLSTNQNISADWQLKTYRWGYRFNRSYQDNRQPGRELADLRNITNLWSVGLQPTPKIAVNVDVGWDSAFNKEQKRTDHTFRIGPNLNWTMTKSMVLTAAISATRIANVVNTANSLSTEADVQWSYRLAVEKSKYRKVQTQLFVRYSNRYAYTRDSIFAISNLTRSQSINGGLNFIFF
jgi:hypothetical protein